MPRKRKETKRVKSEGGVIAVTFEVINNPADHELTDPQANAERLRRGDIINFYRTDKWSTFDDETSEWHWNYPLLMKRSVYIHCRGFEEARFNRARRRFTEFLTGTNIGSEDATGPRECSRRKRWRVLYANLPPAIRASLSQNKEATMRWALGSDPLQALIKRKHFNDRYDPETDSDFDVDENVDIPAEA